MDVAVGDWFARRRVDETLWHLSEPHVDRLLQCNIWYLRGRDRAMLVDTGLGVASLSEAARDLFEAPLLAVATHFHFDHVGSLHEFPDRLAHREAVPFLEDSDMMGGMLRRADIDEESWQRYIDAGYRPADVLISALPAPDFEMDTYEVEPCPPTRVLEEGDVVDLGDRAFEVLHLPGHSPDSIGLWDAMTGVLFSGDAVYDGPLLDSGDPADIAVYVATMERLRALPVEVVHGGHDPSFGRARLVELCDAYIARATTAA